MPELAHTHLEAIRQRAYEISLGPESGTPDEDWRRAEHELRHFVADEDGVRWEEEEASADEEASGFLQKSDSALAHP